MVKYRRQGIGVAFTDTIFNLLLGVTLMFFLALILMNPITEDKNVELKAEFIITMEWPENINSDIDLWVLDPNNQATGYPSKEHGPTVLERDDLGNNTDAWRHDSTGKVYRIEENKEIITVRAVFPGEWVVNVFYYQAKRPINSKPPTGVKQGQLTPIPPVPPGSIPVEVTVTLTKINPKYKIVAKETIILNKQGEERTMIRFSVDDNGNITLKGNDFLKFAQSAGGDDYHGF